MIRYMFHSWRWWGVILALIGLAIGLRFYQLGTLPDGLYWDEMAMLVDAKSVATSSHDMHGRAWYQVLYPSYGDFKLPVYIWLASLSVSVFGISEWALRFPSAVAGVLTVIVGGVIGYQFGQLTIWSADKRKWLSQVVALSVMLVIAVSPWDIMFSRTGFEGHVGQLLVAASVVCLLAASRSRRGWLMIVAAALGALATYTYFSVRFVWPVLLLTYIITLEWPRWSTWVKQHQWVTLIKFSITHVAVPMVAFGLLLIPMLRSPLYADSNRFRLGTDSVLKNETQIIQSNLYREIAGNTPLDRVVFHRSWLTARELMKNYGDNLSLNFMFVTGDPNLRHGTGTHGLFLGVFLPVFLVGLYYLFDQHKRWLLFLVIWWLAALLPASVPNNTPHALRSLNALMPLVFIIGFGLSSIYAWIVDQKSWNRLVKNLVVAIGASLILFNLAAFWGHYTTVYPHQSAEAWQHGYREVAQAILELRGDHPSYVHQFDDRFYLWLMGYGPYQGDDFESWPSIAYQFREFDGIYFKPFPGWDQVAQGDNQVVLVGRQAEIQRTIEEYDLRPQKSITVNGFEDEGQYLVILVSAR